MKSKRDPRHNARKLALTSIFCWLFSEQDQNASLLLSQELLEKQNTDSELADSIISGVKEHKAEIDELIKINAPDWPLEKIAKIDLVILRIAVFELLYNKDTPKEVVVDEAVEIAKEFGNDTSSKFVNGVLGSIIEKL